MDHPLLPLLVCMSRANEGRQAMAPASLRFNRLLTVRARRRPLCVVSPMTVASSPSKLAMPRSRPLLNHGTILERPRRPQTILSAKPADHTIFPLVSGRI